MTISDRLYHEMKFPSLIMELINCPGLLRLRDVRMANIPFVAFPAFSTTSRYEHSLGVCYLAGICANHLGLSEKERLELMIACLYHDVGTPPFAHAMEEVLQARYGFDHEKNLQDLIVGTTGLFDGKFAQIYLGQGLKLHSTCQNKHARKLGIDVHRIAKLAVGDPEEPLASLVNSDSMDLDNIDNVLRASSAMGLLSEDAGVLAKLLATSFVFENGKICLNGMFLQYIREWQRIRDHQYTAIFDSVDDFAYQTMIKKAISLLLTNEAATHGLDFYSWQLTDSEIIHNILLQNPASKNIVQRVLLCRPYSCLGILYVKGNGVLQHINSHLDSIEAICSECYSEIMKIPKKTIDSLPTSAVIANFYPDKRKRVIKTDIVPDEYSMSSEKSIAQQGALLGLFTPLSKSGYTTIKESQTQYRSTIHFSKQHLLSIENCLKSGVLDRFEVTIYGDDNDGKTVESPEQNQLGFL